HSGVVVSARFSPDGARVLTAGEDGYVKLFRAEDGVLVNTLLEGTGPMVRADFSPDGRRVVTISGLGVVALIDTEGGNVVSSEPEMQAYSALFMPDNQGVVVTRGFDPPALWRPSSSGPGERSPFGSFRFQANRAAPSPDGKRIAAINPGEVIRVFDADTGANAAAMRGHRGIVNSIRFSPDDHKLVTASEDGSIRVWDARSGDQLLLLLGHTGAVKRAVLSPDGSLIYSASLDGTVRVWHASAEDAGFMLSSSRTPGYSELSYAPHRDVFVALSHSSPPTLHDSRTLRVTATLSGPNQTCGAFSDDGRVLAIAGVDGSARVLDLETGEQRQLLPAPGNANLVAVSPDHSRVAISTWDHQGWLYDALTGHRITAIPDFRHWSATMAFTPDGRELIAGSPREEGYKRWSAADGTRLQDPPLMASHGNSLRWGPNGSLIISNQGGTAGIWDWSSGQRICELVGHSAPVRGAGFLPDGSRAVTVARDGTLRLWDPKTGTEIAVLRTCRPYPERLSISPDGSTIAVVFEDRDVQFFRSVPVGRDDNVAHPK
ncbi:MAG: hypothetical protein ACOYN0_08370, partial [Phycisphaerales bacterium]